MTAKKANPLTSKESAHVAAKMRAQIVRAKLKPNYLRERIESRAEGMEYVLGKYGTLTKEQLDKIWRNPSRGGNPMTKTSNPKQEFKVGDKVTAKFWGSPDEGYHYGVVARVKKTNNDYEYLVEPASLGDYPFDEEWVDSDYIFSGWDNPKRGGNPMAKRKKKQYAKTVKVLGYPLFNVLLIAGLVWWYNRNKF